jgi:energy-coupling factor transport system ATP-binding protein
MPTRGLGLGLLPPGIRLFLVVLVVTYLQYENRLPAVLASAVLAVLLLVLNLQLRLKYVFFTAVLITFSFITIGNLLFPPDECASENVRFGLLSRCSLSFGTFYALRRVAMVLFGFAWLNATQADEMAEMTRRLLARISQHYPYDRIGVFLFAIFDRLSFEYEVVNQSLAVRVRVVPRSWTRRIQQRVYITYLKLSAVMLRVFTNTPKIAFAIGMHGIPRNLNISSLEIEGLFAGYVKNRDVLADVNFRASEGDVILLKGRYGSGKTTLLRAIARYVPRLKGQARGTIRVGDEVWLPSDSELSDTLPLIRMVTQDTYEFFLGLTVGQELLLHTNDRQEIERATMQMGVEGLLERKISTLSGGEKIRVALACVLASKSKMLLLDDPLSQLDAMAREAFFDALRTYRDEVKPMILMCCGSSDRLATMANRHLAIEDGRIREVIPEAYHPARAEPVEKSEPRRTPAGTPIAGLVNATVERGGRLVLDRFSLTVVSGEIVALMGPNGSGKTTAMLALAGVLPILDGTRFGSDLVGISFQSPELQFVMLAVGDELAAKGKLSNAPSEETEMFKVNELDQLGLPPHRDVLDLSPYEARILSISSMLQGTKILVIDEPTIELPLELIPALFKRLEDLRRRGLSAIVITHAPEVASRCDRIVSLT